MDAVDWKEPAQVGVQFFGDWDPDGVRGHHLVCEHLVGEDVPDFRGRVCPHRYLHPQGLTYQLSNRVGLV